MIAVMTERTHRYTLKSLQEIYDLAQSLAGHFPQPMHVMTGIYELLLNAFEHGNLGLGAKMKAELVRNGAWEEEIKRRLALPEHAGKQVEAIVILSGGECRLIIADQGDGFPWEEYLRLGSNPRGPNGRGLLIAFSSGFDRITFNKAGNVVTCIKTMALSNQDDSQAPAIGQL